MLRALNVMIFDSLEDTFPPSPQNNSLRFTEDPSPLSKSENKNDVRCRDHSGFSLTQPAPLIFFTQLLHEQRTSASAADWRKLPKISTGDSPQIDKLQLGCNPELLHIALRFLCERGARTPASSCGPSVPPRLRSRSRGLTELSTLLLILGWKQEHTQRTGTCPHLDV